MPDVTTKTNIKIAAAFSAAGRYSMLWLLAAAIGFLFARDRTGFLGFLVALVVEWAVTNGPIKSIFERTRPDNSEVAHFIPTWLRAPRSSSFPSGHSSAAAFSTVIWFGWNPVAGSISLVVAVAMATSRVVIRAHHRTDVVAGLAWGATLGLVALELARDFFPM